MADLGDRDLKGDRADMDPAPGLVSVPGFPFPVLASRGLEQRAQETARRCSGAYQLLAAALHVEPVVTLKVLAAHDWRHPSLPYGLPYYDGATRELVVAGEPAEFWHSFVPLLESGPASVYSTATQVYGDDPDLGPFFNLLAVHELGHAFHQSGTAAHWLEETFANVCLHTYIAAREPGVLPVLVTFPKVMTSLDPAAFAHQSLAEFEHLYSAMNPLNYGWFQCHFHVVARLVHDEAGTGGLERVWRRLGPPDELVLSHEQLARPLGSDFDTELTRALLA